MKNRSSFLFILLFFASTQLLGSDKSTFCPDQKNCKSSLLKKAWEHKKKIIATMGAVVAVLWILTQRKWSKLKADYLLALDSDKINAGNALASFTHDSWFINPGKKQCVAVMIANNQYFFPNWKTSSTMGGSNMIGGKLSFTRKT